MENVSKYIHSCFSVRRLKDNRFPMQDTPQSKSIVKNGNFNLLAEKEL